MASPQPNNQLGRPQLFIINRIELIFLVKMIENNLFYIIKKRASDLVGKLKSYEFFNLPLKKATELMLNPKYIILNELIHLKLIFN